MGALTLDDRRSTHANRGGLITASSSSSSSSSARTRLCTVQSSVDVRTFEPQHDANPDRAPTAGRRGGPGPTAAAEALPHRNIPRTVRTAAAAVPAEPGAGGVAEGSAGARSQAAGPGTPGLVAPATGTVRAGVSGHPAAAADPSAEDTGQAERNANRTADSARTTGGAAVATATAACTASGGRTVQEIAERRGIVQDGQRRVGNMPAACQLFVVLRRTSRTQKTTVQVGGQRIWRLLSPEKP